MLAMVAIYFIVVLLGSFPVLLLAYFLVYFCPVFTRDIY